MDCLFDAVLLLSYYLSVLRIMIFVNCYPIEQTSSFSSLAFILALLFLFIFRHKRATAKSALSVRPTMYSSYI